MNWIRQNSFLAAFFAVTTVCAISLGVLLYLQYDKYSSVSDEFATQAAELKRLQSLTPYPSEENLKKLKVQREAMDAQIQTLKKSLTAMTLPIESTSPEQFQDRLRASVLATVELAKQNDVKLPEKFYLGFDGYQTTPPRPQAAMALANQMAGIELVLKMLIENRATQISSVKRVPLGEEEQKTTPQQAFSQGEKGPIDKTSFEVGFKAEQKQVQKILNSIVQSNRQLLVIRDLSINNEKAKAPSKSDPDDAKLPAAVPDPSKPAVTGTDSAPSLKFILGTEKVDVVAQIEIVKFKGNTSK